jgi:hypothetical protein
MLDESTREDLIEQITALFTNEADASEFNEDPDAWAEDHLPEGTEAADVASCLPEVGYRTGLDFSNVASTGGHAATPAGQLSHTYQTIYQQNSFIYAEEGSQVTNIQGDGNAVAQQDVDVDIDVDYGHGEDEVDELPEEAPETTPEGEDAPDPAITTYPWQLDEVEEPAQPESHDWDEPQIDLDFSNTADAGHDAAPVEEAPEAPAPEVDPVEV